MDHVPEPTNFTVAYRYLLRQLLESPHKETNRRTGVEVRITDPTSFVVSLWDGRLPLQGLRRTYPRVAAAEVAWYIVGDRDVTWLQKYAAIWDKFVEADGKTIACGYGWRWRRAFGRDQLLLACGTLARDPTDRRVYVSTWDPATDGLGAKGQRNVPCPVGFTLSVVGGRLNSTLLIRSSDVFVGLPYDVMGHAMLMASVAKGIGELGGPTLGLGMMQVSLAHPHLYAKHYDMAEIAIKLPALVPQVPLVWQDIEVVGRKPDAFVAEYALRAKATQWPEYTPKPEVVT